MKHLIYTAIAIIWMTTALANAQEINEKSAFQMETMDAPATACLTATFKEDGTIFIVSNSGGPQIVVLQEGKVSGHVLKDQFSLYKPMYNLKQPFKMALVSAFGNPGTYTAAKAIETTWVLSDDGKIRNTAKLTVDTEALVGYLSTEQKNLSSGMIQSYTEAKLKCTNAGIQ